MRQRLARLLRRAANRLAPLPPPVFEVHQPVMTEAAAKVFADMISGELGGRIKIGYTKPDGGIGRY